MQRVKVKIEGNVQGVGFRAWTVRTAISLGLSGEVKNLDSGEVEVLMEGDESSIRKMLNLLHRGPDKAEVRQVKVEEQTYSGTLADFIIRT